MKLLFDQNLSPALAKLLVREFPGSSHVHRHGMDKSADGQIWSFAEANSFTIVSKDVDFVGLSELRGCPPKVIWLAVGNTATADVAHLLRSLTDSIREFGSASQPCCLSIRNRPTRVEP